MKKQKSLVTSAKYLEKYSLEVVFDDGTKKEIDLQFFLENSTHPLIRKFLDKDLFKQFHLDYGTLCWGDNEFDISPFSIYKGEYDIKKPAKKTKIKQNK